MERLERKEREFNVRRADILEQASKIFSNKSYHNVTMAEIAGASGFAIGSLYQFFSGKEDLYKTMIGEKLDLMYATIRKEVSTADNTADKIAVLIDAHLKFIENNPDFCRIFFRGESGALSEMTDLRLKLLDDYYAYIAFVEDLLRTGTERGFLRRLPSREIASALIHLIRSAASEWLVVEAKESLLSKRDFILDIFLNGVKKI